MNVVKHVACLTAGVAADMASGPSALAIVADASADWTQVSLDLLSQLEHGPDSRADLVLVGEAAAAAWRSTDHAKHIAEKSAVSVRKTPGFHEAAHLLNEIGPETAELWLESPERAIPLVTTCGVVYVRRASSLGDYGAIGRGCADPTDGMARAQSGLSPLTFMRLQPIVGEAPTPSALRDAAAHLADYEGLTAHRQAILGADLHPESSAVQ